MKCCRIELVGAASLVMFALAASGLAHASAYSFSSDHITSITIDQSAGMGVVFAATSNSSSAAATYNGSGFADGRTGAGLQDVASIGWRAGGSVVYGNNAFTPLLALGTDAGGRGDAVAASLAACGGSAAHPLSIAEAARSTNGSAQALASFSQSCLFTVAHGGTLSVSITGVPIAIASRDATGFGALSSISLDAAIIDQTHGGEVIAEFSPASFNISLNRLLPGISNFNPRSSSFTNVGLLGIPESAAGDDLSLVVFGFASASVMNILPPQIPEPASALLLLLGLCAMKCARRR